MQDKTLFTQGEQLVTPFTQGEQTIKPPSIINKGTIIHSPLYLKGGRPARHREASAEADGGDFGCYSGFTGTEKKRGES
jgi:hypothetical protein